MILRCWDNNKDKTSYYKLLWLLFVDLKSIKVMMCVVECLSQLLRLTVTHTYQLEKCTFYRLFIHNKHIVSSPVSKCQVVGRANPECSSYVPHFDSHYSSFVTAVSTETSFKKMFLEYIMCQTQKSCLSFKKV